ncbi:MAG: helical backbone metal receptor [Rhodothermales bacterium]
MDEATSFSVPGNRIRDEKQTQRKLPRAKISEKPARAFALRETDAEFTVFYEKVNNLHMTLLRSVFLFMMLMPVSSCGGHEQIEAATDDIGREVHLSQPVDRIVSLAPNVTELIFAAGAGHKLIAIGAADDFPPAVDTISRISTLPVDAERIVVMRPDLVLATDQVNSLRDAQTFDNIDVPVYFLRFEQLADIPRAIEVIGELAGTTEDALKRAAEIRQQFDSWRIEESDGSPPRVLFLIGYETLYSFGKGSYVHEMISLAGGQSLTQDVSSAAPVLSEEYVLDRAPEIILGAFPDGFGATELASKYPSWQSVPAIQSGNVYSIEPDYVFRPGPRVVDGIEAMREVIQAGDRR